MDRKLDAGALLVAVAALLLLVSLFLDWFGLDGDAGASAWEVFEALDLVLAAAAIAAVAAAFGRIDGRILLAAAVVAVVVVVSQLVEPPPAGQGADREIGAWLGLIGALGLLAGAALTAAQIAVTVDVKGRERRHRVATVDKRTPTAPAPAPAAETGGAVRLTPEDRFEPSRPVDPEATQPFSPRPDDDPAR